MTKEFTIFLDRLVKGRNIAVDKKYYAASYQDNIFPDSMAENHIRMFCRGGGKEQGRKGFGTFQNVRL